MRLGVFMVRLRAGVSPNWSMFVAFCCCICEAFAYLDLVLPVAAF